MPTFKRLIPFGVRRFFYALKSGELITIDQLRRVPPADHADFHRDLLSNNKFLRSVS